MDVAWVRMSKAELDTLEEVARDSLFLHDFLERAKERFQELKTPLHTTYRDCAKGKQKYGELEIDNNAVVSVSDEAGAYVMGWFWVSDGDAGVTRDGDDDGSSGAGAV